MIDKHLVTRFVSEMNRRAICAVRDNVPFDIRDTAAREIAEIVFNNRKHFLPESLVSDDKVGSVCNLNSYFKVFTGDDKDSWIAVTPERYLTNTSHDVLAFNIAVSPGAEIISRCLDGDWFAIKLYAHVEYYRWKTESEDSEHRDTVKINSVLGRCRRSEQIFNNGWEVC